MLAASSGDRQHVQTAFQPLRADQFCAVGSRACPTARAWLLHFRIPQRNAISSRLCGPLRDVSYIAATETCSCTKQTPHLQTSAQGVRPAARSDGSCGLRTMRRNLPERPLLLGQRSACERSAGSAQKRRDDAGVQYWERACELHRGLEHQATLNATNSRRVRPPPCGLRPDCNAVTVADESPEEK